MIKQTKHFLIAVFALSVNASAQQLPQYTQYLNNAFVLNPSMAGMAGVPELKAVMRSQWTGLKAANDNMKISTFSFNTPLKAGKVGVGGYIFTDKFGPVSKTGINGTYSYRVNINSTSTLSFGLSGAMYLYKLNTDSLTFDNVPGSTDNVLTTGNFKAFTPNIGFGTYFNSEKFWFGFSIPELIPAKISPSQDFFIMQVKQHYFFTLGTSIKLSDNVAMKPSLLLKSVSGAPSQMDANIMFEFNKNIRVGGSYRTNDAIAMLFGLKINSMWEIAYSYDVINSGLKSYAKSTHEIMICYNMVKKEKKVEEPPKDGGETPVPPPPPPPVDEIPK